MRLWFAAVYFLVGAYALQAHAFDERSLPSRQYTSGAATGQPIAPEAKPKILEGVSIEEHLGKSIDLSLPFQDQDGRVRTLAQVFDGKPTLLTLNYFRCTTLCSLQLVNLAQSLQQLGWQFGKDFQVVTVSFDPTDTPERARQAQQTYVPLSQNASGTWHFLTGSQEHIQALTQQLGFFYHYDPESKEFAHGAAVFFVSPRGVISRYLYGITYPANQLKFALIEASENRIGSAGDRALLTCFHYNPTTGKYDLFALRLLKWVAAFAVILLGGLIFFLLRRYRNPANNA